MKSDILLFSALFIANISLSQNWMQLGSDIDGEAAEDRSGWSISMSSDGSIRTLILAGMHLIAIPGVVLQTRQERIQRGWARDHIC